jgi:hypothetical protein
VKKVALVLVALLCALPAHASPWRFLPGGAAAPLLSANFAALAVGRQSAASILSATGFTFARSTVSTCQTSASTIDSTPGVDDACIGSDGSATGLVLQPNITQNFGGSLGDASPRDLGIGWTAGACSLTRNAQVGPDGQTKANDLNCASGQYSPYASESGSGAGAVLWSWQRSDTSDPMQMIWNNGPNNSGYAVTRAGSTTWGMMVIAPTGSRNNVAACDCRDYSGVGGTTSQARHIYADFLNYTVGLVPGEAIATGYSVRNYDRLSYGTTSSLFVSGRIRILFSFYPKTASSESVYGAVATGAGTVQTSWRLFAYTAGGSEAYATINPSTQKVVVYDGTTTYTSANALTWARGDLVDLFVEAGGGVSTAAKYRVNSGAWSDLGTGTAVSFGSFSNPTRFFASMGASDAAANSNTLMVRLAKLVVYGVGGSP